MLAVLTFLAALAALESLHSLWRGRRYNRQFLRPEPLRRRQPPATLILPCRGVDPSLTATLGALADQSYGDFQLLAVVDSADDPAVDCIRQQARRRPDRIRLVVAGPCRGRGQKVHNLLAALELLRPDDEIVAFADSDAQPHTDWLADLASPLADESVGISTGFRWYVPRPGNTAGILRSLWNAGGASLMSPGDCPFAWGGAMAMRVETFRRCRIAGRWEGAVSDDYVAAGAVREADLRIRFEPRCLSVSRESCSLDDLFRWVFRQLLITRVYAPGLWFGALLAHSLSSLVFWSGLAVGTAALAGGLQPGSALFLGLAVAAYLLGALKSALRLRAVGRVVPDPAGSVVGVLTHWFAAPLSSALSLFGLITAALRREMSWRGIRYRLVSDSETEVLAVEDVPAPRPGDSVI